MAQPSDRPISAIASLDLYGYSRLTEQDEIGTHRALMACWRDHLKPAVAEHGGIIVKSTGDGALIRFPTASSAVRAMVCFQEDVSFAETAFPPARQLVFRVGIHLTPTIHEDGDVFGHGVNLAVRLQEAAAPGTIFLSEAISNHLDEAIALSLDDLGRRRFKNIEECVRVYRWRRDGALPASGRRPAMTRIAALLLLILMVPGATPKPGAGPENVETVSLAIETTPETRIPDDQNGQDPAVDQPVIADLSPTGIALARPALPVAWTASEASADLSKEKAPWGEEDWVRPYDGLAAGPLDAVVRTTMAAAERSIENRFEIAEDAYLQAFAYYGRHTPEAFALAIGELDDALTLRADFSAAHGLLAAVHWSGLQNRWQLGHGLTRGDMLNRTKHHLALATVPDPLTHMVVSEMLTASGQHDLAIEEAMHAITLAPERAVGRYAHGRALLFAGRANDAEGPIRAAIRLDPHAPRYLFGLALAQFSMERFDDAKRTLARATARNDDDDWLHLLTAATSGFLGEGKAARDALGRFDRLSVPRRGWFASQIPYVHDWPFRDRRDWDRLHRGMVLAGIPETPDYAQR